MKRLLEWKQRMLQSPLTKKSSSRSGSSSPAVGLYSSNSRGYARSKTPDGALNSAPYEVNCRLHKLVVRHAHNNGFIELM